MSDASDDDKSVIRFWRLEDWMDRYRVTRVRRCMFRWLDRCMVRRLHSLTELLMSD